MIFHWEKKVKNYKILFSYIIFTLSIILLASISVAILKQNEDGKVEVKWLGRSCFYIKSNNGIKDSD